MLEVMGTEYISEHIINELKRETELKVFRVYVADTLYAISSGQSISVRYSELIKQNENIDNRSAEEIINDVISKAGLNVIDS